MMAQLTLSIQTSLALEMVIASLIEVVDNLAFFLNLALSFFESATQKRFLDS